MESSMEVPPNKVLPTKPASRSRFTSIPLPKKLKTELPYDPVIPLLGIYPKEMK